MIREGDRLLIGNLPAASTVTIFRKEVDLFLSDSEVAHRHAYILCQNGRYYVETHPDNVGPQGQAIKPLEIWDRPVMGIHEIHSGDLILVGQTQLRFEKRHRRNESFDE